MYEKLKVLLTKLKKRPEYMERLYPWIKRLAIQLVCQFFPNLFYSFNKSQYTISRYMFNLKSIWKSNGTRIAKQFQRQRIKSVIYTA